MQPTSPQNTHPASPPALPPRGTRASTNSGDKSLVALNQINQPATNAEVGFWDQFTTQVTLVFKSFFPEQPSLLILPTDVINHIFTDITEDKDLCSFILTCITLHKMRNLPKIQTRIRNYKISCLFSCKSPSGQLLNKKATQLIQAVDRRSLTCSESFNFGINSIRNVSLADRQVDAELMLVSIRSEKEFYDILKMHCAQQNINPNSNDFIVFIKNITEELKKRSRDLVLNCRVFEHKLKTTEMNLFGRVFDDIISAYAKQPIAIITPDSFKAKVAELKAFYPRNSNVSIETSLRMAIRHPDNINNITALVAEYLDPSPCSPHFVKLKKKFQDELEPRKHQIEYKILELCGPHSNGAIDQAYRAKMEAKAQLNAALSEFQAVVGGQVPMDVALSLDVPNEMHESKEAHANLVAAHTVFADAKSQFDKLSAELNSLVVRTSGNITGGAIFEIDSKLANLDAIAKTEAIKLANFYVELSLEVSFIEEATRSAALHAIID